MSEAEGKKCLKCEAIMEVSHLRSAYSWHAGTKSAWSVQMPKRVIGHMSKECGSIELYLEMKEKKE